MSHLVKLLSVFIFALSVTLAASKEVCPPNGIACYPADCCGYFRQCAGDIFWSVQETAPGTVCKGGFLVHTRECNTPCTIAAPTEKPPVAPTEKPPVAPTERPPVAPTERPPVAPTEKPVAPTERPPVAPTEKPPQQPATQPPATQPPATQPPATQPPTTRPPATQAPATQAPATQAPATQAPATHAPATQAPATHAPATQAPATQAPATHAPATQAPATQAPATKPPTQTPTQAPSGGHCSLADVFTKEDFNILFPYANGAAIRGDVNQHAIFNYTYLLDAAKRFPDFACVGDVATRKREVAAFLAQTSQETSGWWAGQQYNWGYFFSTEVTCTNELCQQYCQPMPEYPCAPGKGYYGRGPIQLSWNYNYGQVSQYLYGNDVLLRNPDMLFEEGGTAFTTALWFWMTAQNPKPSCHDVMTGGWTPNAQDRAAGRLPGFGMTTNVINGGLECNVATPDKVWNRIGYYRTYTGHFGVPAGDNLECNLMRSF